MRTAIRKTQGILQRSEVGSEIWYIRWSEGRRTKRLSTGTRIEADAVAALMSWRKENSLPADAPYKPIPRGSYMIKDRSPFAVDPAASAAALRDLVTLANNVPDDQTRAIDLAIMSMLAGATPEELKNLAQVLGLQVTGALMKRLDREPDELRPFRLWARHTLSRMSQAEQLSA